MRRDNACPGSSPAVGFAVALALALAASTGVSAQTRDVGTTSLQVEVPALRNAKGTLNCRLFAEAASFPDGDGARTVRAAIAETQARCVFDGLPPGIYAVAVVHDENGNGRLDRNILGMPVEGYGVSNNRTYAFSAPRWEESRFSLLAREPAVMRIDLRY
jgi:uncharacterized protein (DUF2141 family)